MGKNFTTIDPSDASQIATWSRLDESQIDGVLAVAEAGFAAWRKTPLSERTHCLVLLGKKLREDKERLADLCSREMGKPRTQAVKEVEKCATACDWYAAHAEEMLERLHVPTEAPRSYVSYQPLGTVLSIMPWNFPYWQVMRFAAPAIAAGNGILIKHAESTTGSAMLLQEAFDAIGMPAGVAQTVIVGHESIPQFIKDRRIAAVTLTGSERAGRSVAAAAGGALKKSVLELGGSDAYVVLADADVERAASLCAEARFVNTGQSCIAAKRFIVVKELHDRFVEAFIAEAQTYKLAHPFDAEAKLGPLSREAIRGELAKQVEASLEKGAKAAWVGRTPEGPGYWYPATVLTGVEPGMPAFDEETFGPVAAIVRAESDDAAIELANRSRFGLGGAIFSRDVARAEKIAETRLEAGFVAVNGTVVSDPRLPFGGIKESGYGRELAAFGLREFVNVKTVVVK